MPKITYSDEEKKQIAYHFASKFIGRRDVKAIQKTDGSYAPRRSRWLLTDLLDHINGVHTYGHYLLNPEENGEFTTKLLVFDIDLNKVGPLPTSYDPQLGYGDYIDSRCRDIWQTRGLAAGDVRIMQRAFMSQQLRFMANRLMRSVHDNLMVPTTMAYTGSKGVHVYAFTGTVSAEIARKGHLVVIEDLQMVSKRGNNFFIAKQSDNPEEGFQQLEVEVYPKQDSVAEEGGLGNLVRLPLGINHHNPAHPTFFMDARGNIGSQSIMERHALSALTHDDPWVEDVIKA